MKEFYIIKKEVNKNDVFRPTEKITIEEYQNFIESHSEFTWLEDTEHGKVWNKVRPVKKNLRAYLNYNPKDEESFVHLLISVGGYINVQFDYKVTFKDLQNLLDLMVEINCNLWQIEPKVIMVDEKYLERNTDD